MNPQTKAIIAGLFFGVWPLFMNRSGLNGNVSSAAFSMCTLLAVLPFAFYSSGLVLPQANWTMVILAGGTAALGLLSFNGMLANVTAQEVGALFILMTVVQIAVPALYQTYMNGQLPLDKLGGYCAAVIAAYLLMR